jgi:hypothetical protein
MSAPVQPDKGDETTELSPYREKIFRLWARYLGLNDVDTAPYDYRGAFMAGVKPETSAVDGMPHWPDTFKRHGHPTFSVQSQYSAGPFDGGAWGGPDGERYISPLPKIAPRDVTAVRGRVR